jgi:hypothetical protein
MKKTCRILIRSGTCERLRGMFEDRFALGSLAYLPNLRSCRATLRSKSDCDGNERTTILAKGVS